MSHRDGSASCGSGNRNSDGKQGRSPRVSSETERFTRHCGIVCQDLPERGKKVGKGALYVSCLSNERSANRCELEGMYSSPGGRRRQCPGCLPRLLSRTMDAPLNVVQKSPFFPSKPAGGRTLRCPKNQRCAIVGALPVSCCANVGAWSVVLPFIPENEEGCRSRSRLYRWVRAGQACRWMCGQATCSRNRGCHCLNEISVRGPSKRGVLDPIEMRWRLTGDMYPCI